MLDLPDKIKCLINEEMYSVDDVGMSDSTIILFNDKILKIQTMSEEAENEYHVMEWLQDKLPVPRVLGFERDNMKTCLLMTKVPGEMACSDKYMKNPEQLTAMLAEGLQMLWSVDISSCPFTWNLEKKLQMAKYTVENNLRT